MLVQVLLVAFRDGFFVVAALLVARAHISWWLAADYVAAVRFQVLLIWVIAGLFVVSAELAWCGALPPGLRGESLRTVVLHVIRDASWLSWAWTLDLIRRHLVKLEQAFSESLRTGALKAATGCLVLAAVVASLVQVFAETLSQTFAAQMCTTVIAVGAFLLCTVMVSEGFRLSLLFAQAEAAECGDEDRELAQQAVRLARRLRFEAPLSLLPIIPAIVLQLLTHPARRGSFQVGAASPAVAAHLVSLISTARLLIVLSGIATYPLAELCCRRRRQARRAPSSGSAGPAWRTGNAEWDGKVRELAARGTSIRALLRFYQRLGSPRLMPDFDPSRHTTADVVRRAIIPSSRGQDWPNGALATKLMRGRETVPTCMVTHTWSNLFSHLVAAVVADALGVPEYAAILPRLSVGELGALRSELYWKGKLDDAYWICAFAVDQHASICDVVFDADVDPVTGLPHAACGCGAAKYFSDTAPVREDGQGVLCEMNKFDNVMEFLSRTEPAFGQLVAVDADFRLFQRAWCVAELYAARRMRLPQRMRLLSERSLRQHQHELEDLRVEDMRASNPADKQMILGKISDLEAFNQEIQDMIFDEDGLLQAWRDGFDMIAFLGEVARRGFERLNQSGQG